MMRLRRRDGFAALVDSLCFLAVASIVSLSIIVSVSMPSEASQEWSDYIARAHQALLRCQVQIGEDSVRSPRMEISSLALTIAIEGYDSVLLGPLSNVSTRTLEKLIPSSMSYRWTLVVGDELYQICGDSHREAEEVYSSSVSLSSLDRVLSVLSMWPSLGGELDLA